MTPTIEREAPTSPDFEQSKKLEQLASEDRPLSRVQDRQQRQRIKKSERHAEEYNRNWLIWSVTPIGDSSYRDWVLRAFARIHHAVPRGMYKWIIDYCLANENRDVFDGLSRMATFTVETDSVETKYKILFLPRVGLIAFFAPSNRLKFALLAAKEKVSWNDSVRGKTSANSPTGSNSSGQPIQNKLPGLLEFWQKYGRGKGACLAIVDSGVSRNADELAGRVLATWSVEYDEEGDPRHNYNDGYDEFGHGTETATVAVGSTLGTAPEANLVSIKIPMRKEKDGGLSYKIIDFAIALEMILDPKSPLINGKAFLKLVDVVLVPSGVYRSRGGKKSTTILPIMQCIQDLYEANDIPFVAAIGNNPDAVGFPSSHQMVFSVGSLTKYQERSKFSGFGLGSTGEILPNGHLLGEDITCQSHDESIVVRSGTSFSSAAVAGIFAVLTEKERSASGRRHIINKAIAHKADNYGDLRILDILKL